MAYSVNPLANAYRQRSYFSPKNKDCNNPLSLSRTLGNDFLTMLLVIHFPTLLQLFPFILQTTPNGKAIFSPPVWIEIFAGFSFKFKSSPSKTFAIGRKL